MAVATPSLPRKTFLELASVHAGSCVGVACLLAWPWFTTSTTVARNVALTTASTIWAGSNATYLYLALTGLVLAMAPQLVPRLLKSGVAFGGVAFCYLISSAAFLHLQALDPSRMQPLDHLLAGLWPLACGVSQGFLYICWIHVWGRTGPKATVAIVVGASLIATGTLTLFTFAPLPLKIAVMMLTGIAGSICAWRATRPLLDWASAPRHSAAPRRIPWKLCLSGIVAGLSFGIFQSLALLGAFGPTGWNVFAVPAFMLAAILLALCVFNFKLNFNYMMYRVAFALMGGGAFVMMLGDTAPAWGYGLLCLGYRLFESICWCLCAYLIAHAQAIPTRIGGLCVAALWGGRLMGFEIVTHLPQTNRITLSLFAAVMFGCLITALFSISHNNLIEAWGMKRPNEVNSQDAALEQACAALAEAFALSHREVDVLYFVGKDLTRTQISEELSLSSETIKTHLSHIYQKCGVHTRSDLQALIRAEQLLKEQSAL